MYNPFGVIFACVVDSFVSAESLEVVNRCHQDVAAAFEEGDDALVGPPYCFSSSNSRSK
jgi:hypothetical protein